MVDKFGRRRLLIASTFSYGFIGVIPFFLEDLELIYASRLLLGVSEAAILTTVNTLIADYWDEGGRRRWLTLQGLVGPALVFGDDLLCRIADRMALERRFPALSRRHPDHAGDVQVHVRARKRCHGAPQSWAWTKPI